MDPEPREVALTAVRRASDGAILLGIGTDPARGQQFCRPVGGGVEKGETPEEAARREILEEIGRPLGEVRALGRVDNTFLYRGKAGREIAHLFEGRFADPAMESMPEFPVAKKSLPRIARWFPPERLGAGRVPLVPERLLELLVPGKRPGSPLRVVAVDGSGASRGEREKIWLAEAREGRLLLEFPEDCGTHRRNGLRPHVKAQRFSAGARIGDGTLAGLWRWSSGLLEHANSLYLG